MSDIELFGRRLFEGGDVSLLMASLVLNMIVVGIIVGLIYFRQTRDRDHTFMLVTLNLVVFLVGFFMNSVEVGVGFGFGLFALFGIVRYRTESIPVREMSYLFVVIALGLVNAIGSSVLSWAEVLIANGSLIIALGTLSQLFWRHRYVVRDIVYDQVDNIRPESRHQLLRDLWTRTGLKAVSVEVISVNLLNDTAVLRATCLVDSVKPLEPGNSRQERSRPIRTSDGTATNGSQQTPTTNGVATGGTANHDAANNGMVNGLNDRQVLTGDGISTGRSVPEPRPRRSSSRRP